MTAYPFLKKFRLLHSREFRRCMHYGKGFSGEILKIHLHGSASFTTKLGLTVSKKYGNAVRRNHLKRCVREVFRLHRHQLPLHTHVHVSPKQKHTGITFKEIEKEFLLLLNLSHQSKMG